MCLTLVPLLPVLIYCLHSTCVGNHDYYSGDLDKWLVRIKELGVTGLMNERVFVAPGNDKSAGFYLAGLEDYMTKLMK